MKKILLVFSFAILATTIFAQQKKLLNDFKYRVDNFRAVNIGVNGSGGYQETKEVFRKTQGSGFSGNFGGNYFQQKSTDRILLTNTVGLYGNAGRYRSDNASNEKRKNASFAPFISLLNKWFSKKMFAEAGIDFNGNYRFSRSNYPNNINNSKEDQSQNFLALQFGIGHGRLENVTDMQNALWLNKTLVEDKNLSRTLTDEELNNLGKSITKGNNTRVLDVRRRTKFLLKTVDDYLQKIGVISSTNIDYFSNLNDILFFAFNNQRISGTEKFLRLRPELYANNSNRFQQATINKFEDRFYKKTITVSTGINRYVPQNLKHQNNYGAAISLIYFNYNYGYINVLNNFPQYQFDVKEERKNAEVNAFFEHCIYPNTRTNIIIGLRSNIGYQDRDIINRFYGNVNLNASALYFISYRTRLIATVSSNYQRNMTDYKNAPATLPNNFFINTNVGVDINL